MPKLTFKVKLEHTGDKGTAAFLRAPFDVVEQFGAKRVPVCGTINGVAYRTTLCKPPILESYAIIVCKELREQIGAEIGDTVVWTLERDDAPREVEVPAVLARELRTEATARKNFEAMSYTHRKEIVRWINAAKQEETRTRRLAKAMEILRTGQKWA